MGPCKRIDFIRRVIINPWKASSKEETWSDIYFRKVIEDEIQIDNSRGRLNPECPLNPEVYFKNPEKEDGQEQWK